MENFQVFDKALLDSCGLNRHAVFNIDQLPENMAESFVAAGCSLAPYRQLILIGHAGRILWESVQRSGIASENPIDDFSIQTVKSWFAEYLPHNNYKIIYPGSDWIGLQELGRLAGWHYASPFRVGVDPEWGSWYAYRAVVLADTDFEPTRPVQGESPCERCDHRICIASCPGAAMESGELMLERCIAYRKQPESKCRATCLARIACPVGSAHRYCDEQLRHTYSISMATIERFY